MARAANNRDFQDIQSRPKKSGAIGWMIGLLVTLLVIGLLVWIFLFNAFGWRDQHILPLFADLPFVGELVPLATAPLHPEVTVAELEVEIQALHAIVTALENENAQLNTTVNSQSAEINSMSQTIAQFEAQHEQFTQDRYEFDLMVAGERPQDFLRFFENVHPETAAQIYEAHVVQTAHDAELQNFLNRITTMSTSNAAGALQEMMPAQIPLILDIMRALPPTTGGDLLGAMSVQNRATIITFLSQDVTF